MPYRFRKSDATVEAGMRRIACEQIDQALASLAASGDARAGAVHDIRKRCKKLRGLVRIVQPRFSGYSEENAAFRQIAALLGGARDAGVMQDTFDAVMKDHDGAMEPSDIAPVRAALTRQRNAELDRSGLDAAFAEARRRIEAARERADSWTLKADGWEALSPGVAKTYGRARKAMRKTTRKPSGENHHDWRKWVKYHWYHARLLRDLWPDHMKQRAEDAHTLAELLGDHHDCHVFEQTIRADPDAYGSADTVETVIKLTRRRRALLEEQAHRLGARLQAERTDALVDRWGAWWEAWTREGDLQKAELRR